MVAAEVVDEDFGVAVFGVEKETFSKDVAKRLKHGHTFIAGLGDQLEEGGLPEVVDALFEIVLVDFSRLDASDVVAPDGLSGVNLRRGAHILHDVLDHIGGQCGALSQHRQFVCEDLFDLVIET